jgi:signal recognition particle subunit SRP54
VKQVVGRPIAFASTGERLADFDQFHPDRMASRILGMGDVLSLIEQAEREFDRELTEENAARMLEGRFTLEDFLSQLQQVKKLGPLGGILSLMPGLGKELRQASAAVDDGQVSQVEAIVRSMTPAERAEPATVDGSRRVRIARGSGTTTQEVNQLLRQFSEAQKLIRSPGMLKGMLGGERSPMP